MPIVSDGLLSQGFQQGQPSGCRSNNTSSHKGVLVGCSMMMYLVRFNGPNSANRCFQPVLSGTIEALDTDAANMPCCARRRGAGPAC